MTPRERINTTLNFQVPDRIPIDLGGFQTGIHKQAYQALLNHLGLSETITILDPVQQLAQPSETILERFHVDTRYVCAHGPDGFDVTIRENTRDGHLWHDLKDEFGVLWSMPDDQQLYMDIAYHPLAQATIQDLDDYPFPDGTDRSRFTGVRKLAQQYHDETPFALCTGIGGVVYEYCWYMRGLERWFMDMIENPTFCAVLLDRMLQFWMDYYTGFLGEVGDLVDVVMIGDDLAGQSGPLFSPDFYRSVVKPRQKRLVQHIRSLTSAKIWYHTCGACRTYIPDLLDNGIDILNPVQISARDMDPAGLKSSYGDRMAFWGGGCDSQHVLASATPEELRQHVRLNVEALKTNGAYVFNNVHNIQAGVPAENIVALFEAAYEYGFYSKNLCG